VSDVTLRRVSAIGDVVWTTALFTALESRAKDQGGGLYLSTSAPHDLFRGDSRLAGVIGKDAVRGELIDLTDTYEQNPNLHPIRAYALRAKVDESQLVPTRLELGAAPERVKNKVYIHPAISWANRTFPHAFWLSIIGRIAVSGLSVEIIGTQNETKDFVGLKTHFGTLPMLARLIRDGVFIGSDSGPLQIAAALDVPSIGIYTCAEARFRAPLHLPKTSMFVSVDTAAQCRGCLHRAKPPVRFYDCDYIDSRKYRCLSEVDPAAIADLAAMLAK